MRTPDILAELGSAAAAAARPVLIGFAAESGDPVARGREKLRRKRADMIVANDISRSRRRLRRRDQRGDADHGARGDETFRLGPKTELAAAILDRAEQLLEVAITCAHELTPPYPRVDVVRFSFVVDRSQLADHLRFFQELGVTGVSTDARWRAARAPPTAPPAEARSAAASNPEARSASARTQKREVASASNAAARSASASTRRARRFGLDSEEALRAIREDIGDCTRCKLHQLGRTQVVFGVGNPYGGPDVRRRGAGRGRRRSGHPVRRPRRPAAHEDHRGDRASRARTSTSPT